MNYTYSTGQELDQKRGVVLYYAQILDEDNNSQQVAKLYFTSAALAAAALQRWQEQNQL